MQAPILLFLYGVALAGGLLVVGLVFLFLLFLYLTMIAPVNPSSPSNAELDSSGDSHE